jgi:hypothetical protein
MLLRKFVFPGLPVGEVRDKAARKSVLDPGRPLLHGLVMFSDPVVRRRADGTLICPWHVGTIYQASGCRYLGPSDASTEAVLQDGTVCGRRTMQKIRAQEQGHAYAERKLVVFGARPMCAGEKPAAWLKEALDDAGARKFRHPGKHRYAIALDTTCAERAAVVIDGARDHSFYPKRDCGGLAGATPMTAARCVTTREPTPGRLPGPPAPGRRPPVP